MVWDWIVLRYVFHHHFFICCQGLVSKCFLSTICFHLYFGIMSNFPTFPLNWLKLPKLTLSLSGKSIFVCVIEVLVDVWFDIHRSLVNKILSGNQEKEIPVWHFEDEWCFFSPRWDLSVPLRVLEKLPEWWKLKIILNGRKLILLIWPIFTWCAGVGNDLGVAMS